MKFKHTIKTALTGVSSNKFRSGLTILGVVIGITAIMLVMSLGAGANQLILSQVQGLGSRTLFVVPGKDQGGPGFSSIFADSIKMREVEALQKKALVPTLKDISPMVMVPGSASREGKFFQPSTIGGAPIIEEILEVFPKRGVFFTDTDVRQKNAVAIIGTEVAEKLFGSEDPVNNYITLKQKKFRVIGVFPKKGRTGFLNIDDTIMIPYTTAQQYLVGRKHFDEIIVHAESEESVARTVHDISATLRELHDITDPDDDDFHIHTQADIADRIGIITSIMTAFLTSMAGISLVVGGIGIMNIMLVSVTERTREIGLRKAIGAKNRDILYQFLLEAILLTLGGGAIGITLGASFSFITSLILTHLVSLDWSFTFPLSAAILGLSISVCIGLVFGLSPALQASKKSPMEALRYE